MSLYTCLYNVFDPPASSAARRSRRKRGTYLPADSDSGGFV